MKYVVTLGGQTIEIELGQDGVATIGGRMIRASLGGGSDGAPPILHVNGRARTVCAHREGRGVWRVGLEGLNLSVEVLDERQWAIRAIAGGGEGDRGAGMLRAPMPGLVVRVRVEVGDSVEPGDALVVLEAMKMENELRAVGRGVVKAVLVAAGTAVKKGTALVEVSESRAG